MLEVNTECGKLPTLWIVIGGDVEGIRGIERLAASMDRVLVSIPEHFSPSYF